MVARDHSTAASLGTTMGGAAKGAVGGGILGTLGGVLTGALVGAAASLANPLTLVAVGIGAVAAPIIGVAGATTMAAIGMGALAGLGVSAALHAVGGAITGGTIGAGVGVGFFGAKGALDATRKIDAEEQQYAQHKQDYKLARAAAMQDARGDAAEQYTAAGYQSGFQEGANYVVNQIIAAHQAQAQQGETKFADRCCQKKHHESHAQAVRESQQAPAEHQIV